MLLVVADFHRCGPYFIFHGGSCMPSHSVYLSPVFQRKDDPAIDCMWNSGRFIGMHGFTWYWLISAYRCRQLMSSILFPYLTNKGEALSFLVYWSSYPQVRCFGCFWGYSINFIYYRTLYCGLCPRFCDAKRADSESEPAFWNVAFWLIMTGIVAITLYLLDAQSLQPLQTVSIRPDYRFAA